MSDPLDDIIERYAEKRDPPTREARPARSRDDDELTDEEREWYERSMEERIAAAREGREPDASSVRSDEAPRTDRGSLKRAGESWCFIDGHLPFRYVQFRVTGAVVTVSARAGGGYDIRVYCDESALLDAGAACSGVTDFTDYDLRSMKQVVHCGCCGSAAIIHWETIAQAIHQLRAAP